MTRYGPISFGACRADRCSVACCTRAWIMPLIYALLGVSSLDLAHADTPPVTNHANDYSKTANWLCWPGHRGDACDTDLTTTVIDAGGSKTLESFKADPAAPIDCFYIYPTVSPEPGALSTMAGGAAERYAVAQQFARFASVCRTFAPLYRQFTVAAMMARMRGQPLPMAGLSPEIPFRDVRDAWHYYLTHENHGRGVVLLGHSQGSAMLTQLIEEEIDGKSAQKLLVSAILLGTNLAIGPDGRGDFKHIPLCRSASQAGCVIAYDSFREDSPPPKLAPGTPGQSAARNGVGLRQSGRSRRRYRRTAQLPRFRCDAGWRHGERKRPAAVLDCRTAGDHPFCERSGIALRALCTLAPIHVSGNPDSQPARRSPKPADRR